MSAAPWKPQQQPKCWALTTGWHISVWKTRATLALLRIALKSGTVLQLAEVKWADLRKRWKDINILGLFSCEGVCWIKKIELLKIWFWRMCGSPLPLQNQRHHHIAICRGGFLNITTKLARWIFTMRKWAFIWHILSELKHSVRRPKFDCHW